MTRLTWLLAGLGAIGATALPAGCSLPGADTETSQAPCYGPSCGGFGGRGQIEFITVGIDAGVAGSGPVRSSLCGTGACNPDDRNACAGVMVGDAADASAAASDGFGCFVQPASDPAKVSAQCARAGLGAAAAPCVSSSDCAPGFACVGELNAGTCRQYCCYGLGTCTGDTFCAERPLRNASTLPGQSPKVPVCYPADKCLLYQPGCPDPNNATCRCPADAVCTVVRADGLTSCLPAGTGVAGNPCPCAAGYVCSQATNTCQKLCSVRGSSPGCDQGGKCQSSPFLPVDYGICTGLEVPDAGQGP